VWYVIWPRPRDSLVVVTNHGLRWGRRWMCRGAPIKEVTSPSTTVRASLGAASPGWGGCSNGPQVVEEDGLGQWAEVVIADSRDTAEGVGSGSPPLGIFLLLHKHALTNLLTTRTFKDRRGTRHGFIKSDLTGLHNSVSFKVKYTICMRVRSMTWFTGGWEAATIFPWRQGSQTKSFLNFNLGNPQIRSSELNQASKSKLKWPSLLCHFQSSKVDPATKHREVRKEWEKSAQKTLPKGTIWQIRFP
jgi:hypothetical protein